MKHLKIIIIIIVILMVVSVVNWFVLFKERRGLEKQVDEGNQPLPEEEIDLEEVRRIFEEEGYIEEGQYSPSPDEEYPSLPLGEQKGRVGLKKTNLLGNLAESLVKV